MEDLKWNIRCRYNYWLHGPYGLAKMVEAMPFKYRIKYLRKYGAEIGKRCIIDSGFKIHRPARMKPFKNLTIGNDVYLGHNLLLDLTDKIIFEDNTAMGANCQIWTHVGDYLEDQHDKSDYEERIAPVIIKRGAVCYSSVILNPGVVIGERSRVFAMGMVNRSVPANEIWAGIPSKSIKARSGKLVAK